MLLIIDNYDSFTFNLAHYLQELGASIRTVRNDVLSAAQALALEPYGVVISPGPCGPDRAGVSLDLVRQAPADLPVLGVCLGHQAIGQAFGAEIVAAKTIMHGKTSPIRHDGSGVFARLPDPFAATRYHSLALARETLPDVLRVTAWTADGEIMGLSHVERPLHGVQFHPESIASEHGHALLANFLDLTGEPRKAAA